MTKNVGTLLYLCPEMIAEEGLPSPNYSKSENLTDKASKATKVDVYSFAIIMWELFFEVPPFCESEKTGNSGSISKNNSTINILNSVLNGKRPSIPFSNEEELLEWLAVYPMSGMKKNSQFLRGILQYFDLVRECWDGDAMKRPPFFVIDQRLFDISQLIANSQIIK